MKSISLYLIVAILLLASIGNVGSRSFSENLRIEIEPRSTLDRSKFYDFNDPFSLTFEQVTQAPLKVEDPNYAIPYGTSSFKCFFKEHDAALKFEVRKAWITYEFVDQSLGSRQQTLAKVQGRSVMFSSVFSDVDVKYSLESDRVLEEIILYEPHEVAEIVQKVTFAGVTPQLRDDGIYFWNGERFLFGIPAPVMYELRDKDVQCKGLHYQLEFKDGTYYLRKVIDKEGLAWLADPERKYPVVIDATTESFDDPWEESGLTPFGQYFQNLSEYVSPTSGSLSVKQADFYLPGKGLNLALTRVYTTSAIFSTGCAAACISNPPQYEDGPYNLEYECPPVNVGNGWQLNFPWVGSEYIHFLDGTMYKTTSENHEGYHFTYANNVLTVADGTEYHFSGGVLSYMSDTHGNTITFTYNSGRLSTITDTLGRVVDFSYNGAGQLTQISYGSYVVTYSYSSGALSSVTDSLGRVTSYTYDSRNNWLLTQINYPSGGHTYYTYDYYSQEVDPPDPWGCSELRKYHVTNQVVYSPDLVLVRMYSYVGDFDEITSSTVTEKNEQNITKAFQEYTLDSDGKTTRIVTKNSGGTQLQRVDYTYSARNEIIQEDIYMGTSYVYTEKKAYDSWGNLIYQENGEGEKIYKSYANTNCERGFRDSDGAVPYSSNQFFDCTVPSTIHTALLGSLRIQNIHYLMEVYYDYDANGRAIETRQLFQEYFVPRSEFTDTFIEPGQTSFVIDVPSFQGYAILEIEGLPKPNDVTKTEDQSKIKAVNWQNDGYWDGDTYYARYYTLGEPEEGYEPIGPFEHYPGTSGYQDYTTWVEGYTQYVRTTYVEPEDKYPGKVEYNLNGGTWCTLINNLGSGIVCYGIPASDFIVGNNTLNFQESSSWSTKFEWHLVLPVSTSTVEDISTTYGYDSYGNVATVTDDSSNTVTMEYDTQYHTYLTTATDPLNHTSTATYNLSRGWVASITDAKGYTTSFQYDILGRVTKKILPDLSELEAVYDDENNKVTIYDELDNYAINYYDGIGRLTKTEWYTSPTTKLTETYTYNYMSKLKTRTDPAGHVYSYEYDPLGRPTFAYNPDSTYKQAQYFDTTNTMMVFDENQHKKEFQFDWAGRLLWVKEYTDATNYYQTQCTYDDMGNMISLVDARGFATTYKYESLFGLTEVSYPDGTAESYMYNTAGLVIQMTNAHGMTVYNYNAAYQLVSIQYPDQTTTSFEYDSNGNRTVMTDPAGTSTYTYDNRNRVVSQTRTIDGQQYTVSCDYDEASRVVSATYPNQTAITNQYDALNRLVSIPGYGQFTYDSESLLASMSFSNDVTTTFQYDNRHRVTSIQAIRESTDLLTMGYQYDPVGNITEMDYDRLLPGQQWEESTQTFGYDWLDRITSAQSEEGLVTYSYDPAGNRLYQNDIAYTYNNMNELTSVTSGDSEPWWDSDYQYRKEVTFGTDHDAIPAGYTCTFTFDSTAAALASGDDVRVVYQTETQMLELDRVGDVWNSENTQISFKIQEEIPANATRGDGRYYVYYSNPSAGQPPSDPQEVYVFYDDFNRPNFVYLGNGWVEDEEPLAPGMIIVSQQQMKIVQHQNEYAHAEHTVSADNIEVTCRVKPDSNAGVGWAPGVHLFWNDNNNGNIAELLATGDGKLGCKIVSDGIPDSQFLTGVITVGQYNWLRIRLTSTHIYFDYGGTGSSPVWVNELTKSRPAQLSGSPSKIILGKGVEQDSYTNPDLDNNYSTPGNEGTQFIDDLVARKYILNPPEMSLSPKEEVGESGVNYTLTYDDMGNMITKDDGSHTWTYAYDTINRLIQVEKDQQILAQYAYDGDGNRIKKREWIESLQDFQTIVYVYRGSSILYEKNTDTGQDAVLVYGPMGKLAKKVGSSVDYYLVDHLRSVRLVTDELGNVVTEVDYSPFGESTITGDEEKYLYNGKEEDASGLYYYGARYYDPELGRFISRDPEVGKPFAPQTLNKYVYCLNNPLKYTDPLGLRPEDKSEWTEQDWIDYFEELVADGLTLEDLLGMVKDIIEEILDVFMDAIESFVSERDVDALKQLLKPVFIILQACAEVAAEHFEDFEGVSLEFNYTAGFWGGGEWGVSFVYSATQNKWQTFTFIGFGVVTPGVGVAIGLGFFFWHNHDHKFGFSDFAGWSGSLTLAGSAGVVSAGIQEYRGKNGLHGFVLLLGVGVGLPLGGSGLLTYYRLRGDPFTV